MPTDWLGCIPGCIPGCEPGCTRRRKFLHSANVAPRSPVHAVHHSKHAVKLADSSLNLHKIPAKSLRRRSKSSKIQQNPTKSSRIKWSVPCRGHPLNMLPCQLDVSRAVPCADPVSFRPSAIKASCRPPRPALPANSGAAIRSGICWLLRDILKLFSCLALYVNLTV